MPDDVTPRPDTEAPSGFWRSLWPPVIIFAAALLFACGTLVAAMLS